MTPEELAQQELMARFNAAQDDSEVKKARDDAKRAQIIAAIGSALSTAASAQAQSRGGQAPDLSVYKQIADSGQQGVQSAVADRAAKVQALIQENALKSQLERSAQDKQRLDIDRSKAAEDARHNKATEAAANRKEDNKSPFEKTQDIESAKALTDYRTNGGAATTQSSINNLEQIAKQLESSKTDMTGGLGQRILSAVPGGEHIRKATNPGYTALSQQIQAAILPGMKAMFPGAISNQEAERFVSLSIDPTLDGPTNAKKLRSQIATFKSKADVMEAMDRQARSTGSVKGYELSPAPENGSNPKMDTKDIDAEILRLEKELGLGQ